MMMDLDAGTLLWGLVFGSIGMGYFMYGKKQKKAMPKYSGIALMVYPYFITNSYLLLIIGVVLMALPKFIEL